MRKALVAISDYESGDKLIRHISEFFNDLVTEIHLVTVIELQNIEYLATFRGKDIEEVLEETKNEYKNTLEKLKKTFAETYISISFEVREGFVAETIVATSKEEHIDFIVMGTRQEKITKKLLKNHVRYVIELSNIPVLLFPI